jgi:hypothetical protein
LGQGEFLDGVRQGKWRMPTLDDFIERPKPQREILEIARGSHEVGAPLAKYEGGSLDAIRSFARSITAAISH